MKEMFTGGAALPASSAATGPLRREVDSAAKFAGLACSVAAPWNTVAEIS
ncbi:MAG: hypothetical protein JWP55_2650 [Mycobacterium sp.]|nr:hypothetical protein [Mycobacterium sp.]